MAANVAALNANTHLTAITLTDSGTLVLALTAAQVATNDLRHIFLFQDRSLQTAL